MGLDAIGFNSYKECDYELSWPTSTSQFLSGCTRSLNQGSRMLTLRAVACDLARIYVEGELVTTFEFVAGVQGETS